MKNGFSIFTAILTVFVCMQITSAMGAEWFSNEVTQIFTKIWLHFSLYCSHTLCKFLISRVWLFEVWFGCSVFFFSQVIWGSMQSKSNQIWRRIYSLLFAMSYTTHLSVYTFNFYSTHKLCSDNSQDFIPSYIFMLLQFHTILGDADYPISHFCNQLVYPLSLVFGIIDDFITCRLKLEIFRR